MLPVPRSARVQLARPPWEQAAGAVERSSLARSTSHSCGRGWAEPRHYCRSPFCLGPGLGCNAASALRPHFWPGLDVSVSKGKPLAGGDRRRAAEAGGRCESLQACPSAGRGDGPAVRVRQPQWRPLRLWGARVAIGGSARPAFLPRPPPRGAPPHPSLRSSRPYAAVSAAAASIYPSVGRRERAREALAPALWLKRRPRGRRCGG